MKKLDLSKAIKWGINSFVSHIIQFFAYAVAITLSLSFLSFSAVFFWSAYSGCEYTENYELFKECLRSFFFTSGTPSSIFLFSALLSISLLTIINILGTFIIMNTSLKIHDKVKAKAVNFKLFISLFPHYIVSILILAIGGIIGIVPLLLFILPKVSPLMILTLPISIFGLYICIHGIFATFLVLDKRLHGIAAIKRSLALTKGGTVQIIRYFLLVILVLVPFQLLKNIINEKFLASIIDWLGFSLSTLILVAAYRQISPKK